MTNIFGQAFLTSLQDTFSDRRADMASVHDAAQKFTRLVERMSVFSWDSPAMYHDQERVVAFLTPTGAHCFNFLFVCHVTDPVHVSSSLQDALFVLLSSDEAGRIRTVRILMATQEFLIQLNVDDDSRGKSYAEISHNGEKLILGTKNGKHHDVELVVYWTDRVVTGNWLRLYKIQGRRRVAEYIVLEGMGLRKFKTMLIFNPERDNRPDGIIATRDDALTWTRSDQWERPLEIFAHCKDFGEVGPLDYRILALNGPETELAEEDNAVEGDPNQVSDQEANEADLGEPE